MWLFVSSSRRKQPSSTTTGKQSMQAKRKRKAAKPSVPLDPEVQKRINATYPVGIGDGKER